MKRQRVRSPAYRMRRAARRAAKKVAKLHRKTTEVLS
jgi:hypothetical protein